MTLTKTRVAPAALIVAALATLLLWRCHEHRPVTPRSDSKAAKAAPGSATSALVERPDPKTQPRGSIEGTITDEQHAAIARARVCAELYSSRISSQEVRDPFCTTSDDRGHYVLRELYAAEYSVAASAKPFRPELYHPGGDRKQSTFELAAGEHRTGIDLVLREGGVEITGVVNDVSGGPIAHARVSAGPDTWDADFAPSVETDEQGAFSMWVRPGSVRVNARAEGYGPGSDTGKAPGAFQILLTPESSLAGTVVDARSGQPVPGVEVDVSAADTPVDSTSDASDITDEHGAFRITRIEPGRYTVNAHSAHGWGVSDGSMLVGLGQHVEGVVVKLHGAYRVSGTIALPDKSRCKTGKLWLHEPKKDRTFGALREPDGTMHVDGVLPGSYKVNVQCDGYQSRDSYESVVVADKDIDDLVWNVDAGAAIAGRVVTKSGVPIEGAQIWARTIGGAAREKTSWAQDTSAPDGSYALTGLRPGTFVVDVHSDSGNGPDDGWKVEVTAGASVAKDLVLDDGGTVKGVVVDTQGKPVVDVHVRAKSLKLDWFWAPESVRTRADGSFVLEHVRAGDYRIVAERSEWTEELRKPGSTDDAKQGERVTVATAKTSTVKLLVEAQSGVIEGSIIDGRGAPVSDAFVVAARESNAAGAHRSSTEMTRWSTNERPVLSSVDGAFEVVHLSPGNYTVRAYRKGGGEAIAEHVAVGATTKLVIRATGTLAGIVRHEGRPIEELHIDLRDEATGYGRSETFFRTNGTFSLSDVPAGHFTLTASAENGKKLVTVDLAEGQAVDNLDILLDELVKLTGRVVDMRTSQPVPGIRMSAALEKENAGFDLEGDAPSLTGDDGAFTISDAPRGTVMIRGIPKDFTDSPYSLIMVPRKVTSSGTIDLGDIPILKKRIGDNEQAGELGVNWAENPDGAALEDRVYKVSYIDPAGPAAKTELKIGDVLTSIDGVDITGARVGYAWPLMRAAPGTPLELGVARGAKITVVLAAP